MNKRTRTETTTHLTRTIPDLRGIDHHYTADDYEDALRLLTEDAALLRDARVALLAASSHTPADSNARCLCDNVVRQIDLVLSPLPVTPAAVMKRKRPLDSISNLTDR